MSPSYRIVFYVSGHGFGHSSRVIEVIRAVRTLQRGVSVTVKTSAPHRLFERTIGSASATPGVGGAIDIVDFECDTGMVQLDSLHLDEAESLRRAKVFHSRLDETASSEAEYLLRSDARLVIGDIPPVAFAAAAKANLPAVAIGNFTWDWIYEGYPEHRPERWIETLRDAYRQATIALRLPMSAGFAGLERVTRDIPFIARHAAREPDDVRRWLGILDQRPLVLMSFGHYGLADLDTTALGSMGAYAIVTTDLPTEKHMIAPAPGLIYVSEQRLGDDGYRYEDLVRAADVVVTKPGYGIISECIANDTAMLYTSRGRFPEYDVLVGEMPRYLRARFIEPRDLLAARWESALEQLLASPQPTTKPATNGALIAAETVLDFL